MEDALGGKSLTYEEKEKLKEKLALLKKEYKRTFNRLQRSQRAELVKTHVQRTIKEQNSQLNQEDAGFGSTEPLNQGPDSSGYVRDSQSNFQTPRTDKERKASVSFNLEPEVLCDEVSSSQCSGSGSSEQETEVAHRADELWQSSLGPIPRSRLKLRRSSKRISSSEPSTYHRPLISNTLNDRDGLQENGMAISCSGSPVFKKSVKCLKVETQAEVHHDVVSSQIHEFCGYNRELADSSTTELGQCTVVTVSNCPGNGKKDSNCMMQTTLLSTEDNNTSAQENIENITNNSTEEQTEPLPPPTMKDSNRIAQDNDDNIYAIATSQLVLCQTSPASPHMSPPLCPEDQTLQIDKQAQSTSVSTAEDNSPLSSCTLVEGLLFPVEYYVRTTRRMSRCQRKVDLDAVIQSHLGTSRRGTRGRQRQVGLSGDQDSILLSPSQSVCTASESVYSSPSVTPLGHQASNNGTRGSTRCRRGRGKLFSEKFHTLPVASSPGRGEVSVQLELDGVCSPITSGSQSEKENCDDQTLARRDPQSNLLISTHGTEKSVVTGGLGSCESSSLAQSGLKVYSLRPRNTKSRGKDTLPNDMDDFESDVKKFKNNAECKDKKGQGSIWEISACDHVDSPLPPLSGRISLKHLSCGLDSKDFHLPDEEFGVLKLQKLQSVSHLEPFVTKSPTGRSAMSHRLNNATASPTDNTTIIPSTEEKTSSGPESEVFLKQSSQNFLRAVESRRKQTSSGGHKVKPSQERSATELPKELDQDSTTYCALSEELFPVVYIKEEELEQVSNSFHACKKELFPPKQSHEGDYCEHSNLSDKNGKQATDNLMSSVDRQVKLGPFILERLHPLITSSPDTKEQIAHASETEFPLDPHMEMESAETTNCSIEIKEPDTLPAIKEPPCQVVLSTSLCSVPLLDERGVVSSTPGFPFLGFTPAALSPPHCSVPPLTPCGPKPQMQEVIGREMITAELSVDEFIPVKNGERISTSSKREINRCSGEVAQSDRLSEDCNDSSIVKQYDKPILCKKKCLQTGYPGEDLSQVSACGPGHVDAKVMIAEKGHLCLISQIQDGCLGTCAVDLCPAQWEFSGCEEMCVLAASESAVSLWRPRGAGQWETAHTWSFTEMPVLQILPLAEEKNIVCVALGNLEILEIWALFSCPEGQTWEKRVVRHERTKTARGLSRHRLVCSSGLGSSQVLEILQISEKGRMVGSRKLHPPEHSVLAFTEVEGERDALVGSTMDNNVVIWNSLTGQLLSTIYLGDLCRNSICLNASSDSGAEKRHLFHGAIQTILDKEVLEQVPVPEIGLGFYSNLFVVSKNDGGCRPVLNLKDLSAFEVKSRYRQESLRTAIVVSGSRCEKSQGSCCIDLWEHCILGFIQKSVLCSAAS
ncbi:partner and localizer of BRCA2 [Rhinophrynus dorsalis]